MQTKNETLTLENFGDGAAEEYFQEQLQKVLENILDPNTDPKFVREIDLKFKVKPDGKGGLGVMTIHPSCKLAPQAGFTSTVLMGKGAHGIEIRELKLYEDQDLFDNADTDKVPEKESDKVTPIRQEAKAC